MRDSVPSAATMIACAFALIGSLAVCKPAPAAQHQAAESPVASVAAGAQYATCARLTAQQASSLLNSAVTLTVDTSDGNGRSNCTYTRAKGGTMRLYVVVGADAKQQYGAFKDGVTVATAVSGIGDQAFDSDQGFGAIQGDHFVSAVGNSPGDPTGRRRMVQAMLDALR